MDKRDRVRFMTAFATLCEIFTKEPTKALIEVYFQVLKGFSIQDVENGIHQAIRSLKFFPKPIEVIQLINGGSGNLEDRAVVEAARVLEAIKRHGGYTSVIFDDPVTSAVIKYGLGGWDKICNELRGADEKWFIKDFVKIYQSYAREGMKLSGHLPGIIETKNSAYGYECVSEPVLIDHKITGNKIKRIAE